jgi:uncharacterized protein (DUF1919 family)
MELQEKCVNYNKLFYKFSYNNLNDSYDLIELNKLQIQNKLIFVSQKYKGLYYAIHLKEFEKKDLLVMHSNSDGFIVNILILLNGKKW